MKKYNDAINLALQTIGEQIIEGDLSIDGIYEAEAADLLIETTKEEILSEGFSFNTDYDWELAPDINGYIVIPETVIRIDGSSTGDDVVRKDGKLYNKVTKDYLFNNSVKCDIIWNHDFDDLPPIAQQYIVLKAARILYQRLVGDTSMLNILIQDEREALVRLRLHEDEVMDNNIFDDQSVSRALSRTTNPVGLRG